MVDFLARFLGLHVHLAVVRLDALFLLANHLVTVPLGKFQSMS